MSESIRLSSREVCVLRDMDAHLSQSDPALAAELREVRSPMSHEVRRVYWSTEAIARLSASTTMPAVAALLMVLALLALPILLEASVAEPVPPAGYFGPATPPELAPALP